MAERRNWQTALMAVALWTLVAGLVTPAGAQVLDERFNSVTGTGGGTFFTGAGFREIHGWDSGITGEAAFAGTTGNARVDAVGALGVPTGGVGGTGAGRIQVTGANFNLLKEDFNAVTGVGGGVFLAPTGQPNTSGYTANWDNGITGEGAFAGTFDGAIVVGGVSAAGLPTGGVNGTGAGQLVVNNINITAGNWYAGMDWTIGPLPGASPLYNPNFDDNGGSLTHWTVFGHTYAEPITPQSGTHVCKMFGNWSGPYNASGVYQDLAAVPNQVWELHCYSRHNSNDSLSGTQNYVVMKMEFWSAANQKIQEQETQILSGSSPMDVWLDPTPLQITAPAGTARVRAVIVFLQPANQGGAGLVDTVTCHPIGGPAQVDLSSFSLTANVKGTANTGGGEVLGDYQLRLEDADGDRLIFYGTANGNWQTIGGPLSTAIEADANGVPATGVFNVNSPEFSVVLAFDNARTHHWGRGGTLTLDNLLLGNTNPAGSTWYAGLFWDGLSVPVGDLSRLFLSGDVKGNKVGGAYTLRVEGFRLGSAGLNENFNTVTGQGGGLFFGYDQYAAGLRFAYTDEWDYGITGEGAYGGLSGNAEIYYDGVTPYGFFARGLPTGGLNGTGGGEIRVEGIIFSPGDGWYAGLNWNNQALASTDLSQVTLSANIKGTIASYGTLGDYELRIEDSQGDRRYFQVRANGAWQSVGGPLSTATEGPALSGGGNGVFDLDSPTYSVVVSFRNEVSTWQYGGALAVDNLYLTPVQTRTQLGTISFAGAANGNFQTVGGLLNQGVSTFRGDLNENFNTVTGQGGGAFLVPPATSSSTDGWDTGITGENAFAGVAGNATVVGSVSAQGCTTCGMNGSGGGQIIVDNINPGTGSWWAGLDWPGYAVDMRNLAAVTLSANIKGTINPGAGQTYGTYMLRIEDDGLDYLAFTATANGSWQTIGGPLSTATVGTIGGDGVFNTNAAVYTVTLVMIGSSTSWNTGGTLTIDNLFLTGIKFSNADSYTVTLAFDDEVPTWGTDGMLTVDNLELTPAPNCDGDADVDLEDFARFQACYNGTGAFPTGCDCADLNRDGRVNMSDFTLMLLSFHGPQ